MWKSFFSKLFVKKTGYDYSLNCDFSSIKKPFNQPLHIAVFTGGDAPEAKICKSFFTSKGYPDYIIAADSGLETLELFLNFYKKNDFNPDFILGDMDSIKNKALIKKALSKSNKKECQRDFFPQDKDLTDTELALVLASFVKGTDTKITLIGGCGGRMDHLVALFELFSSSIAPDYWLTTEQVLVLLKENTKVKLLCDKAESIISVMRTTASNTNGFVESNGLEWEADVFRKEGVPSLSNRMKTEFYASKKPVELTARKADFIVAVNYKTSILD